MKHTPKLLFCISVFCTLSIAVIAQEDLRYRVNRYKNDPRYYVGEATSEDMNTAKESARTELANCINLRQKSVSSSVTTNQELDAENANTTQVFSERTTTYSYISNLPNVRLINIPNDDPQHPLFTVFCYVDTASVNQMFREQEEVIRNYINDGISKEYDNEPGFALRNYYYAFVLLNTSPLAQRMKYEYRGKSTMALNFLINQIETLLGNITTIAQHIDANQNNITLQFNYKGKPVSGNLNFDWWADGMVGDNIQSNNGMYILSLDEIPQSIKVYIACYDPQSCSDNLVREAHKMNGHTNFQYREKVIPLASTATHKATSTFSLGAKIGNTTASESIYAQHLSSLSDTDKKNVQMILQSVEKAIKNKQYESIKPYCTQDGYQKWQALVSRGKAQLVNEPEYTLLTLDSAIYCRGMKLQFTFDGNFRPIVEDVCFRLNADHKIYAITFGLSNTAMHDIMTDRKQWSDTAKITLVNFLEDYKTAYALKDTTYLERIFSDQALIITGTVIKVKPQNTTTDTYKTANLNTNQQNIRYKVKSKKEFIADLKRNFKQKTWVNIMFEDVDVSRRLADNSDWYGIQVKQNYYSNNYTDEGYLSLLVDMKGEQPLIHVRVWQTEKVNDLSAETMANKPSIVLNLGKE